MSDLVTRLRAAIDETEQTARKDQYNRPHGPGCGITADELPDCDCDYAASVLRRCAADRNILSQHTPADEEDGRVDCGICIEPGYIGLEFCCDWPRVMWPCPTVRYLADGYGITTEQETS